MANLRPLIPSIIKLCDQIVSRPAAGARSIKLGYETELTVREPTVSERGYVATVRHFATDIFTCEIEPGALSRTLNNATAESLVSFTIDTGGFRSMSTWERLQHCLSPFGVGLHKGAKGAKGEDDLLVGTIVIPLSRRVTVEVLDLAEGRMLITPGQGRSYPTAAEQVALDWLGSTLNTADGRELFADVYEAAHANEVSRWNGSGASERRGDYIRYHGGTDYARREFTSFRRFICATRYGANDTRDALDLVLADWRAAGCPVANRKAAHARVHLAATAQAPA